MSSGVDRPGLWSYFSFGSGTPKASTKRRRASSSLLPRRDPGADDDNPYDKADRQHTRAPSFESNVIGSGGGLYDSRRGRGMISGHVGRYLRIGGLLAFLVLAFLYFAPNEEVKKVEHYVEGILGILRACLMMLTGWQSTTH
jgi:hypothetical protein